jgi:hypothetical protein
MSIVSPEIVNKVKYGGQISTSEKNYDGHDAVGIHISEWLQVLRGNN